MALRALSLFTGIGGFELAMLAAGFELAGMVEWDPFCQALLRERFPGVPLAGDIRDVTGTEFGPIDLICGGFPCQPHSLAGNRRGGADERHLWPEFARLIRVARPRWIVAENVRGLLTSPLAGVPGGVFAQVLSDLDQLGYAVSWDVLQAADAGAPHRRERVIILGCLADTRGLEPFQCASRADPAGSNGRALSYVGISGSYELADTDGINQCQSHPEGTAAPDHGDPGPGTGQCGPSLSGLQPGIPGNAGASASSRVSQSRLGRTADEFSGWLDRPCYPARPGAAPAAWEPPRTIYPKGAWHNERLKALGNAIVPALFHPFFQAIMTWEAGAMKSNQPSAA